MQGPYGAAYQESIRRPEEVWGATADLKGQVPLVLKAGADRDPAEVTAELVRMVRDHVGPAAALKRAVVVRRLPETRSGQILRGTIRKIASGPDSAVPATIEDPTVIPELLERLAAPQDAPGKAVSDR